MKTGKRKETSAFYSQLILKLRGYLKQVKLVFKKKKLFDSIQSCPRTESKGLGTGIFNIVKFW